MTKIRKIYKGWGFSCSNMSSKPIIPGEVYLNFPIKHASLLVTLPHRFVEIPQGAESKPDLENVSIALKNSGTYAINPRLSNSDLVDALRFHLGDMYDTLKNFDKEKVDSLPRNDFASFIEQLVHESKRPFLRQCFEEKIGLEGKIYLADSSSKLEIAGAFYKGDYFSFDGLSSLRQQVENDLNIFSFATHVKKGDYLYRAIMPQEWGQIKRDASFLVRAETNFEDSVGPQVEQFAQDPNYAGKIIRIAVEGPFFKNAGFPIPRVVSICHHFANTVDVKEGDEWVNVRKYLDT